MVLRKLAIRPLDMGGLPSQVNNGLVSAIEKPHYNIVMGLLSLDGKLDFTVLPLTVFQSYQIKKLWPN